MKEDERIYVFIRHKIGLLDRDDSYSRAACAKLRRAVGKPPGMSPDIWDITLQGAPEEWDNKKGEASYAEYAVHTALTLYALHRQGKNNSMNAESIGFGFAIAQLIKKDSNRMEATRRRFNAVATANDLTELAHHARGLIQMLKADDIKMDYPLFSKELYSFQFSGIQNRIRLRWGEQFYKNIDNNEGMDKK